MAETKPTRAAEADPYADIAAPESGVSRQAHFSTYKQRSIPKEEQTNPPSGPQVEQELGEPSEGNVKAFGA